NRSRSSCSGICCYKSFTYINSEISLFIYQHPIPFIQKRHGLFVFHGLILTTHHVLDGDFVITVYFRLVPDNGFSDGRSTLLCLSCSSALCGTFIHIWDLFLGGFHFFPSLGLSCLLNGIWIAHR